MTIRTPLRDIDVIEPLQAPVDDVESVKVATKVPLFELSILGIANAAEAAEVLSAGYVLSGIDDSAWRSAISAGVYAGMLLGGVASGLVADRAPKRSTMLQRAVAVAFAGAFVAAGAPSPGVFLACRVVAGLGVGAATPPLFALAAEISPPERRGACITFVASFWMVGALLAAGLAKAMLPTDLTVRWTFENAPLATWRVYALGCSVPALLATALVSRLAEPARRRRCAAHDGDAKSAALSFFCGEPEQRQTAQAKAQRRAFLALAASWWGLNFGYYGLATWITVVLAEAGVKDVYGVALLYAAANLPGNVAAFRLVDVIGRKALLTGAMGGATLAAFLLAAALSAGGGGSAALPYAITAACAFNAFSTAGWASLDALSVESFGAEDRASAVGLLTAVGRVSSIVAQFVNGALASEPVLLLSITAAFMLFGTCATRALGREHTRAAELD